MAKKQQQSSEPAGISLMTLAIVGGVGLGAYALYKYLEAQKTVPLLPGSHPGSSPMPAPPSSYISNEPAARGTAYQKWVSLLQSYNEQYLTGVISGPVLSARLRDAQMDIDQDRVTNRLTSRDVEDLRALSNQYSASI